MSVSDKLTKSERRRKDKGGHKKALNSRLLDYLDSTRTGSNPEKELDLAREIGDFKGAKARLFSARAIIDVASRHTQELGKESTMFFSEAAQSAKRAAYIDQVGVTKLASKKLLRQLPLRMMLTDGYLPRSIDLERTYIKGLESIPEVFSVWKKVKKGKPSLEAREAKGFLSEEAISLLLARCAVTQIGEGWVPVQSILSEDNGPMQNATYRTGWDTSIYTEGTEEIYPTYRLQVKTRRSEKSDFYAGNGNGFSIIHVSELQTADGTSGPVLPQYILGELQREYEGDYRVTSRLDERTEVLLDMFS